MSASSTLSLSESDSVEETGLTKQVPIPINGVNYRNRIVLAPMVRSGELPTRLLALKYGADLVWGPETIDRSMIGTSRKVCPRTGTILWTRFPSNHCRGSNPEMEAEAVANQKESVIYRLHPERERGKLVFQLGTSDPELAVEAAKLVAADVAGIDVNAGCPKPFSTSGGMGAALLKTPDLLCSILRALVANIVPEFGIGISVKIRLLSDVDKTSELVKKLVATGITGLTIHCRTAPMRPRERAIRDERLAAIVQICHDAGVACLLNGDVTSRDQGLQLMSEHGVDGAMIATAAEKNPSVFRAEADGGKQGWREIVAEYMVEAFAVENRWANTKFMLSQFIPGKDPLYMQIVKCKNHEQVVTVLELDHLLDEARELDERCNLLADRHEKPKPASTHVPVEFELPIIQKAAVAAA
jgi:tRNA-dihydrouridine synthase 2